MGKPPFDPSVKETVTSLGPVCSINSITGTSGAVNGISDKGWEGKLSPLVFIAMIRIEYDVPLVMPLVIAKLFIPSVYSNPVYPSPFMEYLTSVMGEPPSDSSLKLTVSVLSPGIIEVIWGA